MDRFDCQVLMAAFANIYYFSVCRFVCSYICWYCYKLFLIQCRTLNPDHVIKMILSLTAEQQVEVFHKLNESLMSRGLA